MRFAVIGFLTASCFAADGDLQFAELDNFRFASGDTVAKCRLGYRTYGQLNAGKSNAILFPTWFGGKSQDLAAFIGPGKQLDSGRFFVITVDALGNGVSSSPSNSTGTFPRFTIRDMVNSQHRLLKEKLGLNHLYAVTGISMGGMQTFEWMTAYPDFLERAVPIIGSPKLTAIDLLLWQAQLSIIENAQATGGDLRSAMRGVNQVHQFALYTPEYRATHTKPEEFAALKKSLDEGAAKGPHPLDWASQLRAMMSADATHGTSLEKAAAQVKARTLVVAALQDHMVNPLPSLEMARSGGFAVLELASNCGHMATSCEAGKVIAAVSEFLARP